jgi:NitT/TauT family transport system permease protein
MIKLKKAKKLNILLPFVSLGAIIALWAVLAKSIDNEYILPTVEQTVEQFFALFKSVKFYLSFLYTLLRSLIAFLVSFIIATLLAFLCVKSKSAQKAILPIISILRALPTISIVLLLWLWTNSQVAPVIVTMLVVLPTTYTHIKSALESVDKTAVEAGMVDGASSFKAFCKIELPQIMPAVYSAIGGGISLNFKLMVAAEVICATATSIGFLLNTSKAYFEVANMLAIVCASVIFGILIEFIFEKISKVSGAWK